MLDRQLDSIWHDRDELPNWGGLGGRKEREAKQINSIAGAAAPSGCSRLALLLVQSSVAMPWRLAYCYSCVSAISWHWFLSLLCSRLSATSWKYFIYLYTGVCVRVCAFFLSFSNLAYFWSILFGGGCCCRLLPVLPLSLSLSAPLLAVCKCKLLALYAHPLCHFTHSSSSGRGSCRRRSSSCSCWSAPSRVDSFIISHAFSHLKCHLPTQCQEILSEFYSPISVFVLPKISINFWLKPFDLPIPIEFFVVFILSTHRVETI